MRSAEPAETPSEIVIFLPRKSERPPMETARALIAAWNVGRAGVGQDILSGGVTIRLPYDPELLATVQTYLKQVDFSYEIDLH